MVNIKKVAKKESLVFYSPHPPLGPTGCAQELQFKVILKLKLQLYLPDACELWNCSPLKAAVANKLLNTNFSGTLTFEDKHPMVI